MRLLRVSVAGLLLVDLPVALVVAVVGWRYGYRDTLDAVVTWRQSHPWTFVPSLLLLAFYWRKWGRR